MRLLVIICLFGIILSCKKDQLKDEKAVFIGKWEWVHTTYFTNACEGAAIYEELTPASEGVSFELEFQKEGFFELRKMK